MQKNAFLFYDRNMLKCISIFVYSELHHCSLKYHSSSVGPARNMSQQCQHGTLSMIAMFMALGGRRWQHDSKRRLVPVSCTGISQTMTPLYTIRSYTIWLLLSDKTLVGVGLLPSPTD